MEIVYSDLSLSLVLFGNEDNHRELTVRTIVERSSNAHLYTGLQTFKEIAKYSYNKILEYIIQVSISDEACDDNLLSSFKKEVMLSARNEVDASILHLFAIGNALKMPVNSIYPKAASPGVNRDVHNQMLFPLGKIYYPENLDGMISIL